MMPKYWLMKTEPGAYSIDDLKRDKCAEWDGVRNYQARNFMRDEMRVGDGVLFYHSNAKPSGVAGIARVSRAAYPDFTAWDRKSKYYDPKSDRQNPRWHMVDVEFVGKFADLITLEDMKVQPALAGMMVLKKGSRLSVQPVDKKHFDIVVAIGRSKQES